MLPDVAPQVCIVWPRLAPLAQSHLHWSTHRVETISADCFTTRLSWLLKLIAYWLLACVLFGIVRPVTAFQALIWHECIAILTTDTAVSVNSYKSCAISSRLNNCAQENEGLPLTILTHTVCLLCVCKMLMMISTISFSKNNS